MMSLRPFLAHARVDQRRLNSLKRELSIAGADGWQDIEDLRLGRPTGDEIRRVIGEEAGGFIWFGTQAATRSDFTNTVEIPAALTRARSEPFPVVPVFVNVRPSEIDAAANPEALVRLCANNGVLRGPGENLSAFYGRAGRDYVRHAILASGPGERRIAITCLAPPERAADLAVDWRTLCVGERGLVPGAGERARAALQNLRAALSEAAVRRVVISPTLWLPLAVLVGKELGALTKIEIAVEQHTQGRTSLVGTAPGTMLEDIEASRSDRSGSGPAVVVVSCPTPVDGAVARYAAAVHASSVISLRVNRHLAPAEVAGLAAETARVLGDLSDGGREKHLVIRGPVSLAVAIGVASNPVGPITVPLWNGGADYLEGITINRTPDAV